jgi:hypothetical protein
MNFKMLLLIVFVPFYQVNTANVPIFVYKALGKVLQNVMGDEVQKAASKLNQKLDKKLGNDVSIGNVALMDVEMVRVVEPYDKHAIVTDFLAAKAAANWGHLEPISKAIFSKKSIIKNNLAEIQTFLNELLGIYIVLNESETASTEVLLSAKPCLLSNTDHYFKKAADPCKIIAKEFISKIIERFTNIEKLKASLAEYLKFSSEWDSHWRPIYFRLSSYMDELSLDKSEKSNWDKIKDLIDSKRVV